MRIVGGTYREMCLHPHWNELYGSGLRAASALSSLDKDLKFTTNANENEDLPILNAKAKAFGFSLENIISRERQITFSYFHALSVPYRFPQKLEKLPEVLISDDTILQFGMVEQDFIVHGKNVVYDPQSPNSPVYFNRNGSTAENLAMVLNAQEAKLLAMEASNLDIAAKKILEVSSANVLVIKNGAWGCDVFTQDGSKQHFNALETKSVWPIGSGDIFSAVFAFFWAQKNEMPCIAVKEAIMATALYVNSFSAKLPLPIRDAEKFSDGEVIPLNTEKKTIYLAGPFFTMQERWFIEEARNLLTSENIQVFSPYHNVGRGNPDKIYSPDIEAIKKCDVLFANLCGLDSGTIYEIGFAVALNKPVVVFSQNNKAEDLKMITGGGCKVYDDFSSAIFHTIWEAIKS